MRVVEYAMWDDPILAFDNAFNPTLRRNRLLYMQAVLYSVLVLVAWFKLFDYLSVFNRLFRLIIMIEMVPPPPPCARVLTTLPCSLRALAQMSWQLVNWFMIFVVVLAAFTSAEYVAYGYLDPKSYTWLWGFIARFIGERRAGRAALAHAHAHGFLFRAQACSKPTPSSSSTRRTTAFWVRRAREPDFGQSRRVSVF